MVEKKKKTTPRTQKAKIAPKKKVVRASAKKAVAKPRVMTATLARKQSLQKKT